MNDEEPPPSAASKLFGVYELLEQCLLHLPLRDLLLAQRVNKAWFDMVHDSHAIQRVLFMQPSAGVIEARKLVYDDDDDDERPIDMCFEWTRRGDEHSGSVQPILNPFFTVRDQWYSKEEGGPDEDLRPMLGDERFVLIMDVEYRHSFVEISHFLCQRERTDRPRLRSSHDDMLLTHPPVSSVRTPWICIRDRIPKRHRIRPCIIHYESWVPEFTVQDHSGLRLGQLLRFATPAWRDTCVYERFDEMRADQACQFALNEVEPQVYELPEAKSWKQLKDSVDTITGFRMLELMGMTEPELKGYIVDFGAACDRYPRDEDEYPSGDEHAEHENLAYSSSTE